MPRRESYTTEAVKRPSKRVEWTADITPWTYLTCSLAVWEAWAVWADDHVVRRVVKMLSINWRFHWRICIGVLWESWPYRKTSFVLNVKVSVLYAWGVHWLHLNAEKWICSNWIISGRRSIFLVNATSTPKWLMKILLKASFSTCLVQLKAILNFHRPFYSVLSCIKLQKYVGVFISGTEGSGVQKLVCIQSNTFKHYYILSICYLITITN